MDAPVLPHLREPRRNQGARVGMDRQPGRDEVRHEFIPEKREGRVSMNQFNPESVSPQDLVPPGVPEGKLKEVPKDIDHSVLCAASFDHSASVTLRAWPQSVPFAREFLKDAISRWGIDSGGETAAAAQLLVSELTTNAVIHSGGSEIRMVVAVSGSMLHIEVVDNDRTSNKVRKRSATAKDEHGRGLLLISELAERWGERSVCEGKGVWAHLIL